MKKMIFGFALIATCVASATTVTSANTFGVLKVTSTNEETVICVPWVKVGDGSSIDANSLVLTSNLKKGDQLFAYDTTTSTYYTWTLASTPIYLYGQYAEIAAGEATSTITRSADKVVTTLIAPPTTADVKLNDAIYTRAKAGDQIIVDMGTFYQYNGSEWCELVKKDSGAKVWEKTTTGAIPAGKGAWYKAEKGTAGSVTITWNPASSGS